jgi:hypothetical protein
MRRHTGFKPPTAAFFACVILLLCVSLPFALAKPCHPAVGGDLGRVQRSSTAAVSLTQLMEAKPTISDTNSFISFRCEVENGWDDVVFVIHTDTAETMHILSAFDLKLVIFSCFVPMIS